MNFHEYLGGSRSLSARSASAAIGITQFFITFVGLESQLQQSVTNVTLANLVSAGFEADQSEAFADEEQIRKNLAYFERTNPHLLQLLESPGA